MPTPFPPQCKKPSDLYREWARVLDMCEGTLCIPNCHRGKIKGINAPTFDFGYNPEEYEFPIAIVENKLVWRGDTLYLKDSGASGVVAGYSPASMEFVVSCGDNIVGYFPYILTTRTPPRRTIILNGVNIYGPMTVEESDDAEHPERAGLFLTFRNNSEREIFKSSLMASTNDN